MNVPNAISLFRLALIPVFCGLVYTYVRGEEWLRYLAFITFATAAISDFVDGYVARHFEQQTKLGAILDPLADKLLINLSLVFLAVSTEFDAQVPKWLPIIILGRDITIAFGAWLINKLMGPVRVRPRVLGKVATFGHSIGVGWVLLNVPYGFQALMVMVAISLISLVDYTFYGFERVLPEYQERDGESDS